MVQATGCGNGAGIGLDGWLPGASAGMQPQKVSVSGTFFTSLHLRVRRWERIGAWKLCLDGGIEILVVTYSDMRTVWPPHCILTSSVHVVMRSGHVHVPNDGYYPTFVLIYVYRSHLP